MSGDGGGGKPGNGNFHKFSIEYNIIILLYYFVLLLIDERRSKFTKLAAVFTWYRVDTVLRQVEDEPGRVGDEKDGNCK